MSWGGNTFPATLGVNSAWFKLALLTYNLISAIKGCVWRRRKDGASEAFRLLLIHVVAHEPEQLCDGFAVV